MEDVALASGQGLRWMQLDLFRDKELARNFIQRAEKAGYKALVVTLDIPALGKKPGEKNTFMIPPHLSLGNFCGSEIGSTVKYDNYNDVVQEAIDSAATWAKIDWLRQTTRLPIVLKGILTAEDAKEAVKHDIQGILVSNHGGRQLDGVLATVSLLRVWGQGTGRWGTGEHMSPLTLSECNAHAHNRISHVFSESW